MNTELGKIRTVSFGMGGYQDAQFGIGFDLSGEAWGIRDFWGYWATRPERAKWSVDDQITALGEMNLKIAALLKEAKVLKVSDLVGIPVEVTTRDGQLVSWRVLKEVL